MALSVFLFAAAPLIVGVILGPKYAPSATVIVILSPLPVLIAIGNVFGVQLLFPFGHEKRCPGNRPDCRSHQPGIGICVGFALASRRDGSRRVGQRSGGDVWLLSLCVEIETESFGGPVMNSISLQATNTFASIRRSLPAPVKSALRPAWSWSREFRYRMKFGFPPPPAGTDLVGYEAFIEFFRDRELMSVPGDLVEIGAFRGGGTYKLARYLQKHGAQKKVYTIDCFDIQFDRTQNVDGVSMADFYQTWLAGKSQRKIFDEVTAGIPNIVVIAEDSKLAKLPAKSVCFAFIDGNHSDEYVANDFYLIWNKLSPGGVVAFHDYGFDLPNVTTRIDQLCAQHMLEIAEQFLDDQRHIVYIRKSSSSPRPSK
jgi:hypothetical protein